ncbi:MAG: DNA repair protein RadC [Kiritimatiellae bacterium]|jgi:DNA repair protein RadC|nr:DNA repair protein RadC [Kiritimatiellia bacterium]NLE42290.1 DNA repair protein RadC [Lentisphaerota bacterium]
MNESKVRENVREAATFNPRKPNATRALKDDIAESQKPREKMLAGLPMTDAELLAIILGSGFQNHNVLSVAHALLKDYDNLAMLAKAGIHDLKKYDGIGEVKAIQIAAVMEIARRVKASQHDATDLSLMTHPEVVLAKVLGYKMSIDSESFFVLPLDKKCRLCGPMTEVTRGTLDSSLVHPREVFKVALKWSAASVIVAHNHPSGDPTPSKEDLDVTRRLIEAGRVLSVPLTDHVVVGDDELFPPGFHSIRRSGVLAFD